jgi:cytochrome P450
MAMVFEILQYFCTPVGAVLLTLSIVYQLFLRPSGLPILPIVGARPGEWFPLWRARWRNVKDVKVASAVAYNQHRTEACILPVAGAGDYVLLPIEEMQWVVDQPDSDFSILETIFANLQIDHTFTEPRLIRHPAYPQVITTPLTKNTGNLIPDLFEELQSGVDALLGKDPSVLKEVCVFEATQRVICRITNRAFLGLPLCRDDRLLDTAIAYAKDISVSSTLLKFLWKSVRPLVALLLTLPNRIHTAQFFRILRPEVERRLKSPAKFVKEQPNDALQWLINNARTKGDADLSKISTLAGRLLLLEFVSLSTSSVVLTHVIFDLASSNKEHIDELRDEIASVLAANNGEWNKRSMAAMVKLDSTMRESLRLNSFTPVTTMRAVVNPKGVRTPTSNVHLPPGTTVVFPMYPVLRDPEFYTEPNTFKPFRFAQKHVDEAGSGATNLDYTRQAWVTTSPGYAVFGHGRHACPGRFFASAELKLLLAYILMNYDIEALDKRPENMVIGLNQGPPMTATVKVRRRTSAWQPR